MDILYYSKVFVESIIPFVAGGLAVLLKLFLDKKIYEREKKEVKEEVNETLNLINKNKGNNQDDILTLMINNVAELREYYVINKQHARNSFSTALTACILGFFTFIAGVALSYYSPDKNIITYTTVAGGIIEIVAGLFFWLYNKAIRQINLFHPSLLETQKFLTAVQLVEKISPDKRDDSYQFIIKEIINAQITIAPTDKPTKIKPAPVRSNGKAEAGAAA